MKTLHGAAEPYKGKRVFHQPNYILSSENVTGRTAGDFGYIFFFFSILEIIHESLRLMSFTKDFSYILLLLLQLLGEGSRDPASPESNLQLKKLIRKAF